MELLLLLTTIVFGGLVLVLYVKSRKIQGSARALAIEVRDSLLKEYGTISRSTDLVHGMMDQSKHWNNGLTEKQLTSFLTSLLDTHTDIFGAWVILNPNSFFTKEQFYSPYVFRGPKGYEEMQLPKVELEEFYRRPVQEKKIIFIEPYDYPLETQTILVSTIAGPILQDGEVMGALGVDIRLRRSRSFSSSLLEAKNPLMMNRKTLSENLGPLSLIKTSIDAVTAEFEAFHDSISSLSSVQHTIHERMDETQKAIEEITHSLSLIRSTANQQNESTNNSAQALESILFALDQLHTHIHDQVVIVDQSSTTIDTMVSKLADLQNVLQSNTQVFSNMKEKSHEGREKLSILHDLIMQIEVTSKSLNDANLIIQSVSDQTNLLAMNAAIEAAHAGEKGKGFAVVASEIKKLAESSSNQSQAISASLTSVNSLVRSCVDASSQSNRTMKELMDIIQKVHESELSIRAELLDQAKEGENIKHALSRIVEITNKVVQSSDVALGKKDDVIDANKAVQHGNTTLIEQVKTIQEQNLRVTESAQAVDRSAEAITHILYTTGYTTGPK